MSWTSSIAEHANRSSRHPGEALADALALAGVSVSALSRSTGIAPGLLADILQGRRTITADTALRLAEYFGTSARAWLGRQSGYELVPSQARTAASWNRRQTG